ncbi:MAG: type II secretion system protein [Acidobacteriota bacterium]
MRLCTRTGFSFLELMLVIVLIGILANLAIPAYSDALLRARAQAIIGDYLVVRTAVVDYFTRNATWPQDRGAGEYPEELSPYLEDRVQWAHPLSANPEGLQEKEYVYDWENWIQADGSSKHPETGVLTGFTVQSDDLRLKTIIANAWSYPVVWRLDKLILPIESMGVIPAGRYEPPASPGEAEESPGEGKDPGKGKAKGKDPAKGKAKGKN